MFAFFIIVDIIIASISTVIIPPWNIDASGSPAISPILSVPIISSGSISPENFSISIMLRNWYMWFVHCIPVPIPYAMAGPIVVVLFFVLFSGFFLFLAIVFFLSIIFSLYRKF